MVPKYEGNKKVMQQGAKRARTPARNEAVREIPKRKFESMLSNNRLNGEN